MLSPRLGVDSEDELAVGIPVADVEPALVGREGEPVGACQLVGDERDLTVAHAVDAAERELRVRGVGEPEGWVGEEERPIRAVDEVVRAVQPPAFVAVGEDGRCPRAG